MYVPWAINQAYRDGNDTWLNHMKLPPQVKGDRSN